MDELERIEASAVLDFFAAAPPAVAEELGLAVAEIEDAVAFSIGAYPKMLLFNRVLGLAQAGPLGELERWFESRGCAFAVSVTPGAAIEREVLARGYHRGSGYMKFRWNSHEVAAHEASLRIERIDGTRAGDFGDVVAGVFGIGPPLDRWFAALCDRPRWACFGAFDGERLVGTGSAFVEGDTAWLGAAGTLPEARRRGAQSALLAARIEAAVTAGARVLAVETSDRVEGEAGPSFRNVLRTGFEEAYRQQWWLPPESS